MNRAVWGAGVTGIVGFVLGVGVTSWWSPATFEATDHAVDRPIAERSVTSADSRLPASEIVRLQEDLATERDARKSAETRVAEAVLDECLTFLETFPQDVHMRAFKDNLTVTPEMAAALDIKQSEADALTQALKTTRERLDAIEAENLRIVEQSTERTVFEIPGYAEGAAVRETLEADTKKILGSRRGEIFLQKCQGPFSSEFSDFGKDTLTRIEILWKENGGKGEIRQIQSGPRGSMSSSGPFDSLPVRFRNLLEVAGQSP